LLFLVASEQSKETSRLFMKISSNDET
jgi:hypothetical protein